MTTKATASTIVGAGVKTPGSGVYSDPAQVGAMIQKMYPGYYDSFDPSVIGQRWIDVHTPTAGGSGTGATDVLQGPTGTTPLTSTDPNQNMPDLSGLSQFASPIQQPKPQQPQTPLLGGGIANSGSATLAAPKPAPQAPSYPKLTSINPPKKTPINNLKLSL